MDYADFSPVSKEGRVKGEIENNPGGGCEEV